MPAALPGRRAPRRRGPAGIATTLRDAPVGGVTALGVLRPLRPTRTPWADSAPAHYGRFVNRPHRAGPEWFPCSLRSGPHGRDPAIPRRSPRRPPTCAVDCSQRLDAARSGGLLIETARPAPHSRPPSTRFETVPAKRGVRHRFLMYPFVSRRPGPHPLAVPARPDVVRAACHHRVNASYDAMAALSFARLLRQPNPGVLSPPSGNEAPHGAPPWPSGLGPRRRRPRAGRRSGGGSRSGGPPRCASSP